MIEILHFWRCEHSAEDTGVIARWKARVGDWTVWQGAIKRDEAGALHVEMPGKGSCGISLNRESDTWRDLEAAVMAAFNPDAPQPRA